MYQFLGALRDNQLTSWGAHRPRPASCHRRQRV